MAVRFAWPRGKRSMAFLPFGHREGGEPRCELRRRSGGRPGSQTCPSRHFSTGRSLAPLHSHPFWSVASPRHKISPLLLGVGKGIHPRTSLHGRAGHRRWSSCCEESSGQTGGCSPDPTCSGEDRALEGLISGENQPWLLDVPICSQSSCMHGYLSCPLFMDNIQGLL